MTRPSSPRERTSAPKRRCLLATAAILSAPSRSRSALWAKASAATRRSRSCRNATPESTGRDGKLLTTSRPICAGSNRARLAHFVVRLANHWPDDAIEVQTKDPQSIDALRHLLIEYDGSGKASGIEILPGWQAGGDRDPQGSSERRLSHHGAARSRRQEPGNAVRRPPGRPANLQSQAERFRSGRPCHSPAGACAADGAGRAAGAGDCRTSAREAAGGQSRSARKTKPKPRKR